MGWLRGAFLARSNLTDCQTFLEKNQLDPMIGNKSILMHFWIDLIEPVYLPSLFFYFFAFLKSYCTKRVVPLQALWGGT